MKRGRPPKLTEVERAQIRMLYHYGTAPNDKPYSRAMLARMFRVTEGTIAKCL